MALTVVQVSSGGEGVLLLLESVVWLGVMLRSGMVEMVLQVEAGAQTGARSSGSESPTDDALGATGLL